MLLFYCFTAIVFFATAIYYIFNGRIFIGFCWGFVSVMNFVEAIYLIKKRASEEKNKKEEKSMLRWIVRQYLTGYRRAGLQKNQVYMAIFWIPYIMILMPAACGYYNSVPEACCYYSLAIPMGVCFCAAYINPVRMPKMMYLCPLDRSMRRSYIRGACWFRIGFHTSLAAIGALCSLGFGNDWLGALGSVVNTFWFSILCVDMDGLGSPKNTIDSCVENLGKIMVRLMGMVLAFILEEIFISAAKSGGVLGLDRWEQIIIGIMTAIVLLLSIRYMAYLKEMQEEALYYEKTV